MAFKSDTSEVIVAAAGGHHDSSDNAVRSIALEADAPAWQLRKAASAAADRVEDQPYYLDGAPSSRHTYWSSHWVSAKQRVMLLGSRFVFGMAVSFPTVNGFDLGANQWDPKGTFHDTDGGLTACCDDAQGVCWAIANDGGLHKWDAASDAWSITASFPSPMAAPFVVDPKRKQIVAVAWGDGQAGGADLNAWIVSGDGKTRQALTFTPSPGFDQWKKDAPAYAALEYDGALDELFFYEGKPGAAERVYVITPNATATWDIKVLALGPGSIVPGDAGTGGLLNKLRYAPKLGGFVLFSDSTKNLYFLRTE
jgi:hypothetical protein